jgi:hypothetical protein
VRKVEGDGEPQLVARARATGRGVWRGMVSNRGGERRRRKVGIIDKRGYAVSIGGSCL